MNCGDLKMGQVLRCERCGFELEVVKECGDVSCATDACCTGDVTCCGEHVKCKNNPVLYARISALSMFSTIVNVKLSIKYE